MISLEFPICFIYSAIGQVVPSKKKTIDRQKDSQKKKVSQG